jgi:hypothetical protein
MSRTRQIKKNLKKYGKKTRGKSKKNIRPALPASDSKVVIPSGTIGFAVAGGNVVQARPY